MRLLYLVCVIGLIINNFYGFTKIAAASDDQSSLVIYTSRKEVYLRPYLEQFEQESGIKVIASYIPNGILQRITSEGEYSKVDLVIEKSVARLDQYKQAQLAGSIDQDILALVPSYLHDSDGHWIALSRRLRLVFADQQNVNSPTDYLQLASAESKGICIRPLTHSYNVDFFAALYGRLGAQEFARWLDGFVNNLARPAQGKDRTGLKQIQSGDCRLAIANLYYYLGILDDLKAPQQVEFMHKVVPLQFAQPIYNISGAVLMDNSKNQQAANLLLKFLLRADVQQQIEEKNFEFAVNLAVQSKRLWPYEDLGSVDLPAIIENREAVLKLLAKY